jgi:ABC-2 type transport system permease protein
MNTMKWLLRREFWEHKGALLWAPVIAAILIFTLFSLTAIGADPRQKLHDEMGQQMSVNGHKVDIAVEFSGLPAAQKKKIADVAASAYVALAAPLLLILSIVSFFYCLAALSDERRDRSILFWKSLPMSDTQTVLSKVLTAGVVAPLIAITVGVFMSLITLFVIGIIAAVQGVNLIGAVLANVNLYATPMMLLGLLPVYLVWALPTIGWLLMVSAWAKSKTFLWAVAAPLLGVAVVKWVAYVIGTGLQLDWFISKVLVRGFVGVVPGNWLPLANIDKEALANGSNTVLMSEVFTASWGTLVTPQALIGAAAGCAMIYAAIRIRRWKDEG